MGVPQPYVEVFFPEVLWTKLERFKNASKSQNDLKYSIDFKSKYKNN